MSLVGVSFTFVCCGILLIWEGEMSDITRNVSENTAGGSSESFRYQDSCSTADNDLERVESENYMYESESDDEQEEDYDRKTLEKAEKALEFTEFHEESQSEDTARRNDITEIPEGSLWNDEHDHSNCSLGVYPDVRKLFLQQAINIQELLGEGTDLDDVIAILVHFGFQQEPIRQHILNGGKLALQCEARVTFGKAQCPLRFLDECPILLEEDVPYTQCDALPCGHYASNEGWRGYLEEQVSNKGCLQLLCPVCNTERVRRRMFRNHCDTSKLQRYDKFLLNAFIEATPAIKYCPNNACSSIVFGQVPDKSSSVVCTCGYVYCFGCLNDVHRPVSCRLAREWLKDFIVDYTPAWLESNTKQCPQCDQPIEKNQGCDHMFCDPKAGGCGKRFNWSSASATRVADTPTHSVRKDHFVYAEKFVACNRNERLARLAFEETLSLEKQWANRDGIRIPSTLSDACRILFKGHRIIKWTYVYDFYKDEDNHTAALVDDWRQRVEQSVRCLDDKMKSCKLGSFLKGILPRDRLDQLLTEVKRQAEHTNSVMRNMCDGIEQDASYQAN